MTFGFWKETHRTWYIINDYNNNSKHSETTS